MDEYAKQVSAVFLVLLLLLFGLFVMSLERVPGDTKRAAEQAGAIQDAIRSWNPQFLDSFARQMLETVGWQGSEVRIPYEVESKGLQRGFTLEFVDPSWTVHPLPPDLKKFDQAYTDEQVMHYAYIQVENEYLRGRSAIRPPATLGEFAALWNGLQQDLSVSVPVDVARSALIHAVSGNSPSEWVELRPITGPPGGQRLRMLFRAPTDYEWKDPERLFLKNPILNGTTYTHIYTGGLRIGAQTAQDEREVELPVLTKRVVSFNGQTAFKKAFGTTWRNGSFSDSFPELERESSVLLHLSILDATRILDYIALRPTAQFEAFGVKIPTVKALTLGIPLLLGVQFYLWSLLNALSKNLAKETAFKGYPWLGFFEDTATIVVTNLTVLLLPPFVLGILLFQEALSRGRIWLWFSFLIPLGLSTVLAWFSFQSLRTTRKTLSDHRSN